MIARAAMMITLPANLSTVPIFSFTRDDPLHVNGY
jgi:hypothetical protein